ncbi:DinB family protein [Chitinophaga sp.]|uniref:DinB family protein n=1 Tax=Chitinophaga sp. TaxID=1869181 RepID=UPI0031D89B89
MSQQPEVWMRGPIPGIPNLLQPVAHALLQAQEEIHENLRDFPVSKLWDTPFGCASVAFHLQHIKGVLDRLFTYAASQSLTESQLSELAAEGKKDPHISVQSLLAALDAQITISLAKLQATEEYALAVPRGIGRKQIPTTLGGLLFHSAEHTMRHTGQLIVTIKILKHQS